jgi:hypothetical protein
VDAVVGPLDELGHALECLAELVDFGGPVDHLLARFAHTANPASILQKASVRRV